MISLVRSCLIALGILVGSTSALAQEGRLYKAQELQEGLPETYGCAAYSCYFLLRMMFPEDLIDFRAITAILPLDRPCSGQEIIELLERFPLEICAKKVHPKDAIPLIGAWNIVYGEDKKKKGHWFLLGRSSEGDLVMYGKNGVSDYKKYKIGYVQDRFDDRTRQLTGSATPPLINIIEVYPKRPFRHLYLAALLAMVVLISLFRRFPRRKQDLGLSVVLLTLSLSVPMLAGCKRPLEAAPVIRVVEPHRDLGILELDITAGAQERTAEFTIWNDGNATLSLDKVKLSCTCTKAHLSRSSVPPGESAQLVLGIALDQGSERVVTAGIPNNSANKQLFPISLRYRAMALWRISPDSVSFHLRQNQDSGDSQMVNIDIADKASDTFRFLNTKVDSSDYRIELQETKPIPAMANGQEVPGRGFLRHIFRITPTLNPVQPGTTKYTAFYEFSDGLKITQNITFNIHSTLQVFPSTLVLRHADSIQEATLRISVYRGEGHIALPPLTVNSVTCPVAAFNFELMKASPTEAIVKIRTVQAFTQIVENELTVGLSGLPEGIPNVHVPLKCI